MSGVWRPCSRRTNERKWLSEADWQQYSGARAQLRGYFRLSCEFQNFCRWKWLMCAVTDKRLKYRQCWLWNCIPQPVYWYLLFSESLHDETLLMFDHQQHLLPSCIITTDTGNSDKLVELEGFLFIVLDWLKSSVVVCMFFVDILCWLQARIPYFIGFVGPDSP